MKLKSFFSVAALGLIVACSSSNKPEQKSNLTYGSVKNLS